MSTVNEAIPLNYTDRQIKCGLRILDGLDRADERLMPVYSKLRGHERKAIRTIVTVLVMPDSRVGKLLEPAQFQCWGRNISRSGLSLLHHQHFEEPNFVICLGRSPDGMSNWYHASIVRCREVQDGFWEYGAKFGGKAMM